MNQVGQIEPTEEFLRRMQVTRGWHARCRMRHRQKREDLHMGQEIDSAKRLRKKNTKSTCPPPSFRQLAERIIELQRLRQKVRAAESERMAGPRQTDSQN